MDKKRYIGFFPIFMALFIIPIAIRLIPVDIPKSVFFHWNLQTVDYDIFSYFRVILLMMNTFLIIFLIFFNLDKKNLKIFKKLKFLLYPFFVMIFLAVISSILGDINLSFLGAPQRYEGLMTYISYFALFLYALTYDFTKYEKNAIFYTLSAFTIICFIVGLSQFIGKNILTTSFVKKLYINADFLKNTKLVDSDMGFKNMYILTSHYNYASMLSSILSVFFITFFMSEDEKVKKSVSFIMALLSLFMLIGSNARSGIVSLILSLFIMLAVFFKSLIKSKTSLVILLVCILSVFFLGFKFGMMDRFSNMILENKKTQELKNNEGDIKSKIDLKDIQCTKDGYMINYKNTILKFDKNKTIFTDEKGNPLVFRMPKKGTIVFKDPKYKDFSLTAIKKQMPAMDSEHLLHVFTFKNNSYYFDIGENINLLNLFGNPMYPDKVKKIGFKGMEKLGSGRFYIISTTIPLILKSPLIGYGADGFINNYNQDDIFSKLYIYKNAYEVIDKPHNLFLLYSVNFGIIFTAIFIYMVIYTMILLKRGKIQNPLYLSSYAAVLSYVISGFFNDSVVSISPIFWVLFAISIIGIEKGGIKKND